MGWVGQGRAGCTQAKWVCTGLVIEQGRRGLGRWAEGHEGMGRLAELR